MAKTLVDKRWLRWDILINEGNYIQVVKEFDKMITIEEPLIGDLIRRDDALEYLGVASLSARAIKKRQRNG
jgi:hypothetical protein